MKEAIGVVDNAATEMIERRRREMATTTGLIKSNLVSIFMGSIEDDKVIRDMMEIGKEQCRF
ncbi:hypothetical protein Ahy_A06g030039 [Arachis hypogaea]|uniref:Uncharacterized protein n=1 Tax=Arachis hypogaea TaxID=3818 RepID=A0A445CV19_ARAHY|nr:hypothetical protein Ahy_A06g030039 [Arachis hypogaea]